MFDCTSTEADFTCGSCGGAGVHARALGFSRADAPFPDGVIGAGVPFPEGVIGVIGVGDCSDESWTSEIDTVRV